MMDSTWFKARSIVDERRANGDTRDSLMDIKLDEYSVKGFPMSQHAFNLLFGELVEAGADTTANQILTIIFALAKYPWVQQKARIEIDAICSADRSPIFSDFDRLPYVNCIVKEGMRWRPT
jgi:cytochrome P450